MSESRHRRVNACRRRRSGLNTTGALLGARAAAVGETGWSGHHIVADIAGAGSRELPHRPTGAKTVINLNRRM